MKREQHRKNNYRRKLNIAHFSILPFIIEKQALTKIIKDFLNRPILPERLQAYAPYSSRL